MKNKLKAALITPLIIGVFTLAVITGYYFPMMFVTGLVIMGVYALFYVVYDSILDHLNDRDEYIN